jgi:hypothetical protein
MPFNFSSNPNYIFSSSNITTYFENILVQEVRFEAV